MSVWLTIPSKRAPAEVAPIFTRWREMGYKIAVWCDPGHPRPEPADLVLHRPYPGYARAVNSLIREIIGVPAPAEAPSPWIIQPADPGARWFIAAGDDTWPDQSKRADEIAGECEDHFNRLNYDSLYRDGVDIRQMHALGVSGAWPTFGVMQPIGDPFAGGCIRRICGSAWIGRDFATRIYGGRGPLWEEFYHMFVDEHLQRVSQKLGILWQRQDLTQRHDHWTRNGDYADYSKPKPAFLLEVNGQKHWRESEVIFKRLEAGGFAEAYDQLPVGGRA